MSLLNLDNIEFCYGNSSLNSFSLGKISLSIAKGEFVTILGPNGSGKSTLLKLISGLLNPDSGTITFVKREIKTFKPKDLAKIMAFVPQNFSTIFPYSVFEIVMMGRTPYLNYLGIEKSEDIDIVESTLEKVGIIHLRNKGINEISGGEAQRAYIARALVQEPEIMLLDEPNAHLDLEHQISIFDLLNNLNDEHQLTVISVSHDLNLAGYYAERVIFMNEGKILFDDDKEKILTVENIKTIFNVSSEIHYNQNNSRLNVIIKPH